VANHVSAELAEAMNRTSAPVAAGVDEFDLAGLAKAPCRLVRPPRVAAAFAALECRATEVQELKDMDGRPTMAILVIGQVIGIHISEHALADGLFDPALARPIARMGYRSYQGPGCYFDMTRPRD